MTIESNKRLMRKFTEFINSASKQMAEELISPEAIFFVPGHTEPMRGPAGYLAIIGMMRAGFPNIQWSLDELVAEDDKVAARFTMRGLHQGEFFGVPPSGKKIEVKAMNFYRIADESSLKSMVSLIFSGCFNRLEQCPSQRAHPDDAARLGVRLGKNLTF
jgi:steroid delta-isomerase-like uncharacterized protein